MDKIMNTLERQLGEMNFFKDQTEWQDDTTVAKMVHAPLTNIGCESEFAKLNY